MKKQAFSVRDAAAYYNNLNPGVQRAVRTGGGALLGTLAGAGYGALTGKSTDEILQQNPYLDEREANAQRKNRIKQYASSGGFLGGTAGYFGPEMYKNVANRVRQGFDNPFYNFHRFNEKLHGKSMAKVYNAIKGSNAEKIHRKTLIMFLRKVGTPNANIQELQDLMNKVPGDAASRQLMNVLFNKHHGTKTAGYHQNLKIAGIRELIQKALAAKDQYVTGPAINIGRRIGGRFGQAFATGLTAPIDVIKDLPGYVQGNTRLIEKIPTTAGSLAGLSALGYGAYRGGKAILDKFRAKGGDPTQGNETMYSDEKNIKLAAISAVLETYKISKTAGVRDLIARALAAKQKYVDNPAMHLIGSAGIGFAKALTNPIHTARDIPNMIHLPLLNRLGYMGGSLAGLGTLGYGAYRGGKALVHKLTAPDDEHHKTAGVRDLIARALAAKEQYVVDPAARLFGNIGHGFAHGLASPIDTARALPDIIRTRGPGLPDRIGITGGALAGLGTLGYGAYRGGKALVHKLTAPDDDGHH